MQIGKQRFGQGLIVDAVAAFAQAVHITPSRVEGWVNLSSSQLAAGNFESAVTAASKAIDLNPKLMVAHMMLGDALRETNRWEEALSAYLLAVKLERSPPALNRLACALRARSQPLKAEALYLEAINSAPQFTLAKVNLATLNAELHRVEQAKEQLEKLSTIELPGAERQEVNTTLALLKEQIRLQPGLTELLNQNNTEPLLELLKAVPEELQDTDAPVLQTIKRYKAPALKINGTSDQCPLALPADWPMIEALFMIPVIDTVDDYLAIQRALELGEPASTDLLESLNMEPAIRAARMSQQAMLDPILAECQLRLWHALACADIPGLYPGHFKYTQNKTRANRERKPAEPIKTAGTVRSYITDIYPNLPAGLPRGLASWMAISDIHAFADGNGRIALTWLNRELEWAGETPVIFNRDDGIGGEISATANEARSHGGDISRLLPVIRRAQARTVQFCEELNNKRL